MHQVSSSSIKSLTSSLQEYDIPMYFVQGPPGSSRERVKMKIDLVSIKIGNFHDSRMSHNYFHLFNYYRVRFVHYASHYSRMSHGYFHLFNYC